MRSANNLLSGEISLDDMSISRADAVAFKFTPQFRNIILSKTSRIIIILCKQNNLKVEINSYNDKR